MESKIDLGETANNKKVQQTRVLAEEAKGASPGSKFFSKETASNLLAIVIMLAVMFLLGSQAAHRDGLISSIAIFVIITAVRLLSAIRKK